MRKLSTARIKTETFPISSTLLAVTIILVGANLRPAITSVGPMLQLIRASEGLSSTALGILGAVPLLTFAAVSPLVHLLSRRIGLNRSVFLALLVLAAGTIVRSLPGLEIFLWLGTILLAAGIGICNVLIPAVVKQDFPDHVPVMTGAYSAIISGFAGLASGFAVPLGVSGGWPLALGIWSGLALVGAALWAVRLRSQTPEEECDDVDETGGTNRSMWSSAVAWYVAAFTALQSMSFYLLVTWLPSVEISNGVTASIAGWHLSGYQVIGVAAGLTAGQLIQKQNDQRAAGSIISGFMIAAMLGFILAPDWVVLWLILAGLSSGAAFMLALTLVSVRARNARDAERLSAMAQGVGYLAAAVGPIGAGALYQIFENWTPVLVSVLAISSAQLIASILAGRRRFTHKQYGASDALVEVDSPENLAPHRSS